MHIRQSASIAFRLGLIALIVWGGIRSFLSSQAQAVARTEIERLEKRFGTLEITDPNLVHLRAIEQEDPMHWAWRFHLPANANVRTSLEVGSGSGSSGSSSSSTQELIGRVRLYVDSSGRLVIYKKLAGGSSLFSVGSPKFCDFLKEHWDELEITQIAHDGPQILQPNTPTTLLEIKLPQELIDKGKAELPKSDHYSLKPRLVKLTITVP